MFEVALKAFTTFFATVGPVEAAILFAALAPQLTRQERWAIASQATLIATGILLFFAFLGQMILDALGVSTAALQAAGGIILLMIALDMIFAWKDGPLKLSPTETQEARRKEDIAVFPLATPLLAGPGSMSGAMLMMTSASGDWHGQAAVIGALLVVMVLTLVLLLAARELDHLIGLTAQKVVQRVFGILLAALAMQSIFNGVAGSNILARTMSALPPTH
jgi:multiple antibiotic resistance protein